MEFNEIWTKEKNDQLRQFNREHKSSDFIREFFGEDLKHDPKKRYCSSGKILPFVSFVNEIKICPEQVEYTKTKEKSVYPNKIDHIYKFKTNNGNDYVLILYYIENFNVPSYEIAFTSKKYYDKYIALKKEILDTKGIIDKNDNILLSKIFEDKTKNNELYLLFKNICYILLEEYPLFYFIYKLPFSITETDNIIKIDLYRSILRDSFKDFTEDDTDSEMKPGKKIYYYIKNK